MNEWQQEWQPTERDNRLHELATRYHTECEAYDQTVCTGPIGQDGIMPANPNEMALINRNAHAVRKSLEEEAQREGIGREELSRAISKWHGSLPNAIYATGCRVTTERITTCLHSQRRSTTTSRTSKSRKTMATGSLITSPDYPLVRPTHTPTTYGESVRTITVQGMEGGGNDLR